MQDIAWEDYADIPTWIIQGYTTMGLMTNPALTKIRDAIVLNEHSRVLRFSTEGDTDRENYKAIVLDGKNPSK